MLTEKDRVKTLHLEYNSASSLIFNRIFVSSRYNQINILFQFDIQHTSKFIIRFHVVVVYLQKGYIRSKDNK